MAFSLIEVMVVVAILGVFAALAAPSLLGEVQKATLAAASDEVAAFIARAQNEAIVARRCVRVRVTGARTITADVLNTFDCDKAPATASKIDGTGNTFVPLTTLRLDRSQLTLTFDGTLGSTVPNECNPAPGGVGPEIRFRPNGRIFSSDGNLNNDDAVLLVTHVGLPSTGNQNRQKILVNGHGLTCVLRRGEEPLGITPSFDCP